MNRSQDRLGIFWDGEEVDGVTFYSICDPSICCLAEFPLEIWPEGTEVRPSLLSGDGWLVHLWDVRVPDWRTVMCWKELVGRTLGSVLVDGCSVAWLALEECFVDPPDLFLPEFMSGGVLAVVTQQGFSVAPADLDEPLTALSDQEMLIVRSHAGGIFESA